MASGPLRVTGIDHIQLAMPAGGEDKARNFYAGVLGFGEVQKPAALAARGGCWFKRRGMALHLGVEEPFDPARKAHPAFRVSDLDAAERSLRAAGAPIVPDSSLPGTRRIYTADPFGNRIELIEDPTTLSRHRMGRVRLSRFSILAVAVLAGLGAIGYGLISVRPERLPPAAYVFRNGKIAFTASTNIDEPANSEILIVNPDGSGLEKLTRSKAPDYAPAWSPDGTRIAFARERRHDPEGEVASSIYVMNADGSAIRAVTTGEAVRDGEPSWSPDGSRIAFSSNRAGFSDLWIVNMDGTGLRQLTHLSGDGLYSAAGPAWSPDPSVIAFTRSPLQPSGELEPRSIWIVDVEDGEMLGVTRASFLDQDPSWSPDARRIAFSRRIRRGTAVIPEVHLTSLDEGTDVGLGRGWNPAWSPDGRMIAFEGRGPRPFGLYLMRADGSDVGPLPLPQQIASSLTSPAWQPLPVAR